MKNILSLIQFTFREALSKNIFKIFIAISTIVIIILALVLNYSTDMIPKVNDHSIIEKAVTTILMGFIPVIFGGGIFLSIFSTAGMTADMLDKGNIDLLLSKPVARWQIITGKFLGVILFVLVNVAYAVFGIWLVIAIKFNYWGMEFLLSILTITYAFAVLYSLIMLLTIITRNSVLAMISAYLIFFVLSPLLAARDGFYPFIENKIVKGLIEFLYYITPQITELGNIASNLAGKVPVESYIPFFISFILMLLILSSTIIIFNKKDY